MRVNLDSHDEQSLLVLFKKALQQYRCYLRKSHFDGKSINEFPVKSPVLNLEDIEWKTLLCTSLVPRMRYCLWYHMKIWTSTFPHVPYVSFFRKSPRRRIPVWKRTTGYRKYAACCFAIVSACCPVSLYLHTYLVCYVTAVCIIACLSIVRCKLFDLYEWLH